jgi:O-glycosyl hydrolase
VGCATGETMNQVQVGDAIEASREFGAIVHRCAVLIGSKTELGKRSGQTKEIIRSITTGNAHMHDVNVIRQVATAAADVAGKSGSRRMADLIDAIFTRPLTHERPGRLPHRECN